MKNKSSLYIFLILPCLSYANNSAPAKLPFNSITCDYTWSLEGEKFYQKFDIGLLQERLIIDDHKKEIYIFLKNQPTFLAKNLGFPPIKRESWFSYAQNKIDFLNKVETNYQKNTNTQYLRKGNTIQKIVNSQVIYDGDFKLDLQLENAPYIDISLLVHIPFVYHITNLPISSQIFLLGNTKIYPMSYYPVNGRVVLNSNKSSGEMLFDFNYQTNFYTYKNEKAQLKAVLKNSQCEKN